MAERLSMQQLAVLQNMELRRQEQRLENLRILMAAGLADENGLLEKGYSFKEIKYIKDNYYNLLENRNGEDEDMKNLEIRTNGNNLGGTVEINPVMKKICDSRLFNGMVLKTVENGSTSFPMKSNTKAQSNITGGIHIDAKGGVSGTVEIRPEIISVETSFSQMLLNDLTPEVKKIYIDDTFVEIIEEVSIGKVATELNKLVPVEVANYGNVKTKLFEIFNPKYLGNNYVICNTTDYKELSKQVDATGRNLVIKVERDDITGLITPFIDDIPVIVTDEATAIYLINPSCICHVVGSADELIEGMDVMESRKGIKSYERIVNNAFGVIDTNGIVAIKKI